MRRLLLLLVVVALVAPTAGCLETYTPLHGGMGAGAWPLEMVGLVDLQDAGRTGAGIKVAVIDTGIDATHPEFDGVQIEWADLVNGKPDPYDDNGHGTHVAGIIAAQGSMKTVLSGFYLKGAAPDASLIIIKAIGKNGKGEETTVARAVQLAVTNRADVIVLSLGGGSVPLLGTDTERAVSDAVKQGVFVVAAAGNAEKGQTCSVTSPASASGVIAVGAVDKDAKIADFSCRGDGKSAVPVLGGGESDPNRKPEVVAPGVAILGAWCRTDICDSPSESGYVEASGTSQAAPFVGGVIALVLEGHPELRRGTATGSEGVEKVKAALMVTSGKIGTLDGKGRTAHDAAYGYGLLRAKALDDAL